MLRRTAALGGQCARLTQFAAPVTLLPLLRRGLPPRGTTAELLIRLSVVLFLARLPNITNRHRLFIHLNWFGWALAQAFALLRFATLRPALRYAAHATACPLPHLSLYLRAYTTRPLPHHTTSPPAFLYGAFARTQVRGHRCRCKHLPPQTGGGLVGSRTGGTTATSFLPACCHLQYSGKHATYLAPSAANPS